MVDQGNNFYLISLSFLITCLLDNVWGFWGRSFVLIISGNYELIKFPYDQWQSGSEYMAFMN